MIESTSHVHAESRPALALCKKPIERTQQCVVLLAAFGCEKAKRFLEFRQAMLSTQCPLLELLDSGV